MSLISKAFYSGIGRVFSLPRLSVPLILTLGLTLGAVLTVIAISSALLFQPLQGVPNEKKLHAYSINVDFGPFMMTFVDMKRLAHINEYFSEFGEWTNLYTKQGKVTIDNSQHQVNIHSAQNNILEVLGAKLLLGQDVTIDSPERFVWISNSLWQSAFSGSETAVGATIQLHKKSFIIAGIIEDVPAIKSHYTVNLQQVWRITNLTELLAKPESNNLNGQLNNIIFLQKNINKKLTAKEITEWVKHYVEENFTAAAAEKFKNRSNDFQLVISKKKYRDNLLGSAASLIITLLIAVIGLLLMAAMNLLNLFIAHYQARSKEFAIQLSLGASLNKLRFLIFLENVPCFSLAAITGLLSAGWIIKLLPILAGNNLPLLKVISLNLPTLIATVIIVVVLTFIFSLLATIDVNKHALVENLNSSGKGLQAQSNQTLSKSLMVFQLSLASILLTSSVMLALQSYQAVYGEVGYTLGNSYEVSMQAIDKNWQDNNAVQQNESVLSSNDIAMMHFIESTISDSKVIIPSNGPLNNGSGFTRASYTDEETDVTSYYEYKYFNDRYFSAFKIPFLAGSNLTKEQISAGDSSVIIDATIAKFMYPKLSHDEIIGRKMKNSDNIIQGIVAAIKSDPGKVNGLNTPLLYTTKISYGEDLTYTVMMPEGKKLTTAMLEEKFKQQFPLFKNLDVTPLQYTLSEMTKMQRTTLWIIITVTLLTLILAAIGVSGLTQMTTNHRKYELAVRMATGAKQSLLVRFILKDALWMLVIGLGLGFAISVFGYEQLQNNLTMLPEFNGVAMSILDMGLIAIVLLSVIIPAWRVIRADPMQALRED